MSEDQIKKVLANHPDMICPDHKRMLVFCRVCFEEIIEPLLIKNAPKEEKHQ